jgi:molecular chaperone DnaK
MRDFALGLQPVLEMTRPAIDRSPVDARRYTTVVPADGTGEDIVVGIDLGTTNSVVAAMVDGKVEVVRDRHGRALVPSVVGFLPDGKTVVGRRARERRLIDAPNTIFSAKRIIGRPFSAPETQAIIGQLPYRVVAGENEEPVIQTRAGLQSVIDIGTRVLTHLRVGAEQTFNRRVAGCVVTVPANFSDGQREATRRAAAGAGMEVLRVINEPTAAAVALGFTGAQRHRVAVFDLGGGTFDVTVLDIHDNIYEVLATGGEPYLGGDDFDRAIADQLRERFLREHRVDLASDPQTRAQLLEVAETIKTRLSSEELVEGRVEGIAFGAGGAALDLDYVISRAQFDALINDQVERALDVTSQVLSEAGITPDLIDDVALVGGSTLIPAVRRGVSEYFGREPHANLDPLEIVASGASMQAHSLWSVRRSGPPTPVPAGGPGSGPAPGVADMTNAALLMDVTSHSLGVATVGDNVEVLIAKNTSIPCEGSSVFSTVEHGQTEVRIRVCQGEHKSFSAATPLGDVRLTGLVPRPRGATQIEVEFLVDANGIVQVHARDRATGQEAKAVLSVLGIRDAPA